MVATAVVQQCAMYVFGDPIAHIQRKYLCDDRNIISRSFSKNLCHFLSDKLMYSLF